MKSVEYTYLNFAQLVRGVKILHAPLEGNTHLEDIDVDIKSSFLSVTLESLTENIIVLLLLV